MPLAIRKERQDIEAKRAKAQELSAQLTEETQSLGILYEELDKAMVKIGRSLPVCGRDGMGRIHRFA
jgi:septal ring factor EnvC (AmiA/AmiB activator)